MTDEYIEPPRINSTLEWKDVTLPPSLTAEELDSAIFSMLKANWLKTARVIGDVLSVFLLRSIQMDDEVVGARLHALAQAGLIESAGNLFEWRHSEVRLKASD